MMGHRKPMTTIAVAVIMTGLDSARCCFKHGRGTEVAMDSLKFHAMPFHALPFYALWAGHP
jgi:hypothetical protein